MIKILFLAANIQTHPLQLDEECRAIDAALRTAEYRDRFQLDSHWAVRTSDIQELLLRHQPHIVHFSGHGAASHEIVLLDSAGKPAVVPIRALERLFSVLHDNLRGVVLNACFSEPQASAIARHIDWVVGAADQIGDNTARRFAAAFYRALGYGKDVRTAFDLARNQLEIDQDPGQHVPHLLALRADPSQLRLF